MNEEDIKRTIDILRVAAHYIRQHPVGDAFYEGELHTAAELAEDCEFEANVLALAEQQQRAKALPRHERVYHSVTTHTVRSLAYEGQNVARSTQPFTVQCGNECKAASHTLRC